MSDAEWALTEPTLPAPAWKQGKGGRPAGHCRRDVVDAIRYLVKEGICWRAMPADFPPWQTVYDVLDGWQESGATEALHAGLRRQCRIAAGRKPEPSAAIIDSQSVKAAETVGKASRGFDAGKKINGRKRHIAVDAIGLLLTVLITAAAVQDRDAAKPLLWNLRRAFPRIKLTWADGSYAGKLVTWAKTSSSSPCRLSGVPMTCTASKSCPAGGSSSGPWPGSLAAGAPSATTNASPNTTRPSSTGP
jgi:transposase